VGDRGYPINYRNCVVRADLTPKEANGVILESLERFREHGTPGSWHVGPSMRPKDLGERLLAHGFSYGGDDTGMAADLSTLREDLPVPDELRGRTAAGRPLTNRFAVRLPPCCGPSFPPSSLRSAAACYSANIAAILSRHCSMPARDRSRASSVV
jgi:hypothetical protein